MKEQKQILACTYDNPASMRRECWQDGHLQASYNWMEFDASGIYPPKMHIGADIGKWKAGKSWGDLRAMEAGL